MYMPLETIQNELNRWAVGKFCGYIIYHPEYHTQLQEEFDMSKGEFVSYLQDLLGFTFQVKKSRGSIFYKQMSVETFDWDYFCYPTPELIQLLPIKVILDIKKSTTCAGTFNTNTKEIKLNVVCPYSAFDDLFLVSKSFENLLVTIRHEIQHLSQWIGESTLNKPMSHGLPPRKVRSKDLSHQEVGLWKENNPENYAEYINDDLEFYPLLEDEIASIENNYSKYVTTNLRFASFIDCSRFFLKLKEINYRKWKYAVKIAYLELGLGQKKEPS